MFGKIEQSNMTENATDRDVTTVDELREEFIAQNPAIAEAMRLFNMTSEAYLTATTSLNNVPVIFADHSLLPS